MRRVYITGGNGMVGRNLVDVLQTGKIEFVAPARLDVDLMSYADVHSSLKAFAPDVIVHCAGTVGGIAANIASPFDFCAQNARMGLNLIGAAVDLRVPQLINLGSSCMYPREAENPLEESSILSGPLEPTNEGYAIAKILGDRLCQYASAQHGLSYKTLIPCNLYGRYDRFDPLVSHMIPSAILKVHNAIVDKSETVEIWGDGQARREFMYAGDLADFIHFAIFNFEDLPPRMNVGLGHDYTIDEYYEAIAKVLGYDGHFSHDRSKPAGMRQKLVDVAEQKKLGWAPRTDLASGIRQTFEYFLEQQS